MQRLGCFVAVLIPLLTYSLLRADDLKQLQGTWEGTNPEGAALVMVIKNQTAKSTIKGKGGKYEMEQEIKVDDTADPKTIDFLKPQESESSKPIYGIYKLEGDKFTVCLNVLGGDRPTKFAAGKGGGSMVTYTRATSAGPTLSKSASSAFPDLQGKWEGTLRYLNKSTNAPAIEDVSLSVEGNVLTFSRGKGEGATIVGKSVLAAEENTNSKLRISKGMKLTPEPSAKGALLGLAIYQVSRDKKSWTLVVRPDGKQMPERISGDDSVDQVLTLARIGAAPAAADGPGEKAETPVRSTPKKKKR